ncbi:MAG: hypothetical protein A2Y53_04160 [Chloroflexi bacterium RBG_16_47_49]|nr:MAG: hypothetical protein A2Y53_04160 [Chloroflexi bacterium RBG_16_47_49]
MIGQCFVSLKGNQPELADGIIWAYIYGFRIRSQFRNLYISSRMMHNVVDDLKQRGILQATLDAGQDNFTARRLYDRLGYIVAGADPGRWSSIDVKGKRRHVHEPAWRMIKDLD